MRDSPSGPLETLHPRERKGKTKPLAAWTAPRLARPSTATSLSRQRRLARRGDVSFAASHRRPVCNNVVHLSRETLGYI